MGNNKKEIRSKICFISTLFLTSHKNCAKDTHFYFN
jgi:hypothetical protein